MSDYLKGKRVVDPVLTSIARGYKNAAFIGERIFPVRSNQWDVPNHRLTLN
ncbi:hypothetical protein RNQ22_03640 [Escherichia coli]|uniref:hypothetical protein n=1 Tax=Escherichia coli TaxID=562 RepID=UPI0013316141|nr:hypothetical protein [Escherichia coli]MDW6764449.1 hypothetical protein [Escherichia coli]MDW6951788.1 hypothetical protein [Escherichia coli]